MTEEQRHVLLTALFNLLFEYGETGRITQASYDFAKDTYMELGGVAISGTYPIA